jgi:hypothetical protein
MLTQHHAFCPTSPFASSNTTSKSIIAILPPEPHFPKHIDQNAPWLPESVMHVTDRLHEISGEATYKG